MEVSISGRQVKIVRMRHPERIGSFAPKAELRWQWNVLKTHVAQHIEVDLRAFKKMYKERVDPQQPNPNSTVHRRTKPPRFGRRPVDQPLSEYVSGYIKAYNQTEEGKAMIARRAATRRAFHKTPEGMAVSAAHSKRKTECWATPGVKEASGERRKAFHKTPEGMASREGHSKSMTEYWATPGVKEARAKARKEKPAAPRRVKPKDENAFKFNKTIYVGAGVWSHEKHRLFYPLRWFEKVGNAAPVVASMPRPESLYWLPSCLKLIGIDPPSTLERPPNTKDRPLPKDLPNKTRYPRRYGQPLNADKGVGDARMAELYASTKPLDVIATYNGGKSVLANNRIWVGCMKFAEEVAAWAKNAGVSGMDTVELPPRMTDHWQNV